MPYNLQLGEAKRFIEHFLPILVEALGFLLEARKGEPFGYVLHCLDHIRSLNCHHGSTGYLHIGKLGHVMSRSFIYGIENLTCQPRTLQAR
jgi:hypothetical protein